MNRSYPAKLLLFGEYAILAGGEALAIPYPQYQLSWISNKSEETETKKLLQDYLSWLSANNFVQSLDLDQFENDLSNGLGIESNIPVGYGLGSSGALVSAVYDRYCFNKIDEQDLTELKLFLGKMENYFHQKSSGLDPLVSFLQSAIHVNPTNIKLTDPEKISASKWEITLLDTGKTRQTAALVEQFNDRMKIPHYHEKIIREYLPLVHECIEAYLSNNSADLHELLFRLSIFQLAHFDFAIPQEIHTAWSLGFASKQYVKLCGAGGGGFMIQFKEK